MQYCTISKKTPGNILNQITIKKTLQQLDQSHQKMFNFPGNPHSAISLPRRWCVCGQLLKNNIKILFIFKIQ